MNNATSPSPGVLFQSFGTRLVTTGKGPVIKYPISFIHIFKQNCSTSCQIKSESLPLDLWHQQVPSFPEVQVVQADQSVQQDLVCQVTPTSKKKKKKSLTMHYT